MVRQNQIVQTEWLKEDAVHVLLLSGQLCGNYGRKKRAIWSVLDLFHERKHLPDLAVQGWLLCVG